MAKFTVIDEEDLWNKSLDLVESADPCHGFLFHKTYKSHQNGRSIKLLEYRNNDQYVLYPLIIFDIPKEISNEKYKYATSAYGFTGHLMKGSKEFIDSAFKHIDQWIIKEKIAIFRIICSNFSLAILERKRIKSLLRRSFIKVLGFYVKIEEKIKYISR